MKAMLAIALLALVGCVSRAVINDSKVGAQLEYKKAVARIRETPDGDFEEHKALLWSQAEYWHGYYSALYDL